MNATDRSPAEASVRDLRRITKPDAAVVIAAWKKLDEAANALFALRLSNAIELSHYDAKIHPLAMAVVKERDDLWIYRN